MIAAALLHLRIGAWLLFAAAAALIGPAAQAQGAGRPLTIDDVLGLTAIDRVALSPDGEWAAVTIIRPAGTGEVHGRTNYEVDTSRADVWLVSRKGSKRRNLTNGAAAAAGFWCAAWSPDGRRLAMLSTAPEGTEPRGGDNVRLYVWDRDTDILRRASQDAVMTQTRLGAGMYRMSITAPGSNVPQRCSVGFENAPFVWLDADRLLVATLPPGRVAGLIDEQGRPFRHMAATATTLAEGELSTLTAVGSGAERTQMDEMQMRAILKTYDLGSGEAQSIAEVPVYPFAGELSVRVAPEGDRLAVMATTARIPPEAHKPIISLDDGWSVERRLGFVDFGRDGDLRWVTMPAEARLPLDLSSWSPDGERIAFRARGGPAETATPLFVADAATLAVERVGSGIASVGEAFTYSSYPADPASLWLGARRLLVRGSAALGSGAGWSLVEAGEAGGRAIEGDLRLPEGGGSVALAGEKLVRIDPATGRFAEVPGASVPAGARIIRGRADEGSGSGAVVIATTEADGSQRLRLISIGARASPSRTITLPAGAELVEVNLALGAVVWREPTKQGLFLRQAEFASGQVRDLLALNEHLGRVRWGETRIIDYRGAEGQALKAALILPPDSKAGQRYPVITWVYGGYEVHGPGDYWLDPYLPGIYNLQLYAARGYVVLVPSIPLKRTGKNTHLTELAKGVLPAIDRLVELGIADADRVGVMGQSYGGFSVMALLTQTNRFKAGVAVAGFGDLADFHHSFDATARGYPGIEHEKSGNAAIAEVGAGGLGVPPHQDPALYWRGSPLSHADRVTTPLLIVHGEFDVRANLGQAESFFSALDRQGKTARLLRYWGENHAVATSPANVRSVLQESIAWFEKYLGEGGKRQEADMEASVARLEAIADAIVDAPIDNCSSGRFELIEGGDERNPQHYRCAVEGESLAR